ncbi:MAG: thymidine phosphorylase [Clostridia bacterium]|nr:thymidine phosphorylase [Clostridia bacterium]
MRIYDVITKKKHGEALTEQEIRFFVSEYTAGNIPDYQVSSLLMAICLKGMNDEETYILTDAIARSGDSVDLSRFGALTADKHSTGGVGDKTTLIVAPLAAALGCKVAKMSGRGLGHTGGTVDKLESFPGYRVALSPEEFISQVEKIGIAVIGQSGNLAPADKKLYALRDVTATVDSIPLITSSIMGKKLAAGSHSIVLDVKCGSGAFLKTPEDAEILAKNMVRIGRMCGRNTMALITNMDVPLGYAVGNSLEVKEAIATLKGEGPKDLTEICLALASSMAHLALGISFDEAEKRARELLYSGAALRKFKEWICAQGADPDYVDNTQMFKGSLYEVPVYATEQGYVAGMDAEAIGVAAMVLGAGRRTKDDVIDHAAGIVLKKRHGDAVKPNDVLAILYTDKKDSIADAEKIFRGAIRFSLDAVAEEKIIYAKVTGA